MKRTIIRWVKIIETKFQQESKELHWVSKSRKSEPPWSLVQINENHLYPETKSTWHGVDQLLKTAKTGSLTSIWSPRKKAQGEDGTMMATKYSSNQKNHHLSHPSRPNMEKAYSWRKRLQLNPLRTGFKQWKIWSSRRKAITSNWTCTTDSELKSVKTSSDNENQ